MLKKEDIIHILLKEFPTLKANYHVKRIGLFGSYVEDKADTESDIDLIIEFEKPIGLKFIELCDYLETIFNRRVDILTPEGLESIRVKEIYNSIVKNAIYVPAA